ncbi:MAG: tetratricopeptide repeat protein [Polyangiaceae bacterium]
MTIVEDELAVADEDALKADLLAERARLLEALGKTAEARKAYGEALGLAPLHAAALRGLEALLRTELTRAGTPALNQTGAGLWALASTGKADLSAASVLALHLERIAEAVAPGPNQGDADPRLAAWLHVERAEVLDKMLRQAEQALGSLVRAVSFDPSPGPVRDALTRHLVNHRVVARLVESLVVEAEHERDDDRASRLLYSAARFLVDKLQSPTDAVSILQRAVARAPQTTSTMRRALGELIRLLEAHGELQAAADVRQKQLGLLRDQEAIVHEHVRLSEVLDTIGAADRSAEHARQALAYDPEDLPTRERLERALQRLGRHEERVASWVAEGNAKRPAEVRVTAFLRAADIANRHLKSREEAIAYLRAAWVIDPGNTEVFDALSALLAPPARDPDTDKRGVRARIDLYTQAVSAAVEPARQVGLLEKLVSIWEDELVQPARALEVIEQILEIEPARRTAILALQRNAERAGDSKRLARALSAEAALTSDADLQRKLLLRAAEILSDRVGDRDRAFVLVERALAIDPSDQSALRARWRLHDKAGRYDEARKALLALVQRDPHSAAAFDLWVEVAVLDELRLKRPHEAVRAYQEAARIRPRHPLPKIEIARLLRAVGDWGKLVEALMALASTPATPSTTRASSSRPPRCRSCSWRATTPP